MRELFGKVRLYLLQGDARCDPEFRALVARQSHQGIRVLTGGMSALLGIALAAQAFLQVETDDLLPFRILVGGVAVGVAGFVASFLPWSRRHPVFLGCATVYLMTMAMVWSIFLRISTAPHVPAAYIGEILFMVLTAVLMLSLHPLHTLWLGLALTANVWAAEGRAVRNGILIESQTTSAGEHVVLLVAVLFITALSAVAYRRDYLGHLAHEHEIQAAEATREAQSGLLLAENAASMGRFAATVSHELNTPLGALASSAQSLQGIAEKKKDATPEKLAKLEALSVKLAASIQESAQRLSEVVGRMQRVSNLDRAEMLEVNLNELLKDVVALSHTGTHEKTKVLVRTGDLPKTMARPQQLSAVFTNLLQGGLAHLQGNGTIEIHTEGTPAEILVTLHSDDIRPQIENLASIFEPGFEARGGRVVAKDWSLFSSREMVRRHGGDITAEGSPEKGFTVRVRLRVKPVAGSMPGV